MLYTVFSQFRYAKNPPSATFNAGHHFINFFSTPINALNAQSTTKPTTEWDKTFGPFSGTNILAMNDGGYLILGSTGQWVQTRGPGGWSNESMALIKIDSQGSIQWTKNYGAFGSINDAILTSDNGFAVLSGRTLCKIDSQGVLQWNKTYDTFPDRSDVSVRSAIQTSDNGFVIVGTGGGDRPYFYSDGRFVKTDSNGNLLWNKTYGKITPGVYSDIYSIVETSDGYAFAGATTYQSAGQQDMWLVKINRVGDILWEKRYGESSGDECDSLIKSPDGGFVLSGFSDQFGRIIKVDSAGNLQWSQNFDDAFPVAFSSIAQTKEGGYVCAGGNGDVGIIAKCSASGRLQWSENFAKGKEPYILSVAVANDGSYAFAGYKGSEENKQIWAFKIPHDNMPSETFTPTQTETSSNLLQVWLTPLVVLIVLLAFFVGLTLFFRRKK